MCKNEVRNFIWSACNISPKNKCTTEKIYVHYRKWCGDMRYLSRKQFVAYLKQVAGVRYGVHWIDGESRRGFKGVDVSALHQLKTVETLTPEAKPTKTRPWDLQLCRFLAECCIVDRKSDEVISSFDLHQLYLQWPLPGSPAGRLTHAAFTRQVKRVLGNDIQHGVHWTGDKSERGFRGIKLK